MQQSSPENDNLYGVYFTDANHGIAVGGGFGQPHTGIRGGDAFIRTTDGGENWVSLIPQLPVATNFYDVQFIDQDNGVAVGDFGTVLRTTDGGATWSLLPIDTERMFLGVSMIDAQTMTLVGREDGILRTNDGGGSALGR